jgi:peptidoglycan/xylan/chitin deacetylase (PgdA/CDA1 family)
MSARVTPIVWYIVLAPFATLILLGLGSVEGLWVLFFSHLLLVATTLIPSLQGFGPVITYFNQSGNEIWLTIDDGPDPQTTPAILNLLDCFEAKATFFLIGQKASSSPALVQMILNRGHSIGNHTQTHPQFRFWSLGPRGLRREVDSFEKTMAGLGLPVPYLFRAPAGMKNPFLHPILSVRNLSLVGWSARAYDTRVRNAAKTAERLLRSVRPGAIVLLHDCSPVSLETLEILLKEFRHQRLRCVIPRPERLRAKRSDGKYLDCESACVTFWRMEEYYSELASALQERLEVISDQNLRTRDPDAQLERLRLASERIDRLKQSLPAEADPMLRHFLDRMSLTKALELIRSRYLEANN